MAFIKIHNVAFRGISACVPQSVEENVCLPFYNSPEEAQKVIASTGIERRHISPKCTTAMDLGAKAAECLLEKLNWDKSSIDLIAFCTQNPDYINLPNSFLVHKYLDLNENTMCLDYFHGCPGWVSSLSSVGSMIQNGTVKRAILFSGDTVTKDHDISNHETRPLFGEGVTATALEFDQNACEMMFYFGTLSTDGDATALKLGGYRNPYSLESLQYDLDRKMGKLSENQVIEKMESMDVFSFAISKVPKAVKKLCAEFAVNIEDIDFFTFHQANKLILENIAKRLKISIDRVPMSLKNYGNTTSASIPLTLVSECGKILSNSHKRHIVCGFGTGISWGTAYFETNNLVCPTVVEI